MIDWERCPRGSLRRGWVLTELYKLNPQKVRAFDISLSTGGILTPSRRRSPDDLTRDEWRQLFEEMGAGPDEVRHALRELGFSA